MMALVANAKNFVRRNKTDVEVIQKKSFTHPTETANKRENEEGDNTRFIFFKFVTLVLRSSVG